jgi:hypothetical protein
MRKLSCEWQHVLSLLCKYGPKIKPVHSRSENLINFRVHDSVQDCTFISILIPVYKSQVNLGPELLL